MPNSRTGHIDWGRWSFDYAVADKEGLALVNVYYNEKVVLGKASVPVVRVKYLKDRCGPYHDQILWKLGGSHGLQKISNCNNEYVCCQSFTSDNMRWLEIGVYARIGAYHIYQVWYLSETGTILPTLWSKGLSCNINHTHHVYWRLDFDIDGPDSNRVWSRINNLWGYYPMEENDIKIANRIWLVRNEQTGDGAWIIPRPDDGHLDDFSSIDVAVRLFHRSEELEPWQFGTNELGYLDGEYVGNSDIVFWYIAHLYHNAAEGGDAWHSAGPTIVLHGYSG